MPLIGPQIPTRNGYDSDGEEGSCQSSNLHNDEEYGPAPPPPLPKTAGPSLPPHLVKANPVDDEDGDEDAYAPALPPQFIPRPKRTVGPTFPSVPPPQAAYDSDDEVGPMPAPASAAADDPVREFMEREERRKKAQEEAAKPVKPRREEWMLVPPTNSGLLGSLDPTKLKARQFSRSARPSQAASADNSLWTETPAERQARIKDEVDGKRRRATEVADEDADDRNAERKRMKYDEEVKAQVEAYNRETRGQSLVDMHKSAKGKESEQEKAQEGIWDHARDMSVGGRLMDDKQRSRMIQDARTLGDRFGKGKSGFL
ncbi:hypothetical protein BU17DRAFT_42171 [Hysterangium stoloniferum]|nr:hypothetical protein BU17DRAFT_42171 [Hysterangium stoloniferum]